MARLYGARSEKIAESAHAGKYDFENHRTRCKCGWKSPICSFIYEARELLEKHFNKVVAYRQKYNYFRYLVGDRCWRKFSC